MKAVCFSFENSALRTLGTPETPLFVAVDVVKALGFKDTINPIKRHVDPEDLIKAEIDTNGGRQTVNCVNESGLYALIFGSKLESAKRFKRWVTSEVLPAIRKTGRYEYTDGERNCDQYMIRKAVAKRAKASSVHYQTIYNALYDRFHISSYKQLRHDQIGEALTYIECFQLREPTALPAIPEDLFVMPKDEAVLFANFIYDWKYLFRAELDAVIALLRAVRSPMSGALWDAVHNLNLELLEATLKRHGIEVRKPDQLALWHK